jgi:hypothetical protein
MQKQKLQNNDNITVSANGTPSLVVVVLSENVLYVNYIYDIIAYNNIILWGNILNICERYIRTILSSDLYMNQNMHNMVKYLSCIYSIRTNY